MVLILNIIKLRIVNTKAIIMAIISILFYILIDFVEILYEVTIINDKVIQNVLLVIFVIFLWVAINKKFKSSVVIMIFITMIIGFNMLFDKFADFNYESFQYNSPNGSNTLVIKEGSWLLGTDIKAYERLNLLVMREIKGVNFNVDDGYRPFQNGDVEIEWSNEYTCMISYYDLAGNQKWKNAIVEFK